MSLYDDECRSNHSVPWERAEIDHVLCDLTIVEPTQRHALNRLRLTVVFDLEMSGIPIAYVTTREELGSKDFAEVVFRAMVARCGHNLVVSGDGMQKRDGATPEWGTWGLPTTVVVDNGYVFRATDRTKSGVTSLINEDSE